MAIDLKLDNKHDLEIVNGDLVLVRNREEVLQAVTIRLLFIRFEWAYNFVLGVPWASGLFDVRVPRVKKEAWLRDAIVGTPGVLALTSFEFNIDREENGAFVAFTAETIYGPVSGKVTA